MELPVIRCMLKVFSVPMRDTIIHYFDPSSIWENPTESHVELSFYSRAP